MLKYSRKILNRHLILLGKIKSFMDDLVNTKIVKISLTLTAIGKKKPIFIYLRPCVKSFRFETAYGETTTAKVAKG